MKGHLRTRALSLLFLIWRFAWGSATFAGHLGAGTPATLTFALAASLLGLGETLMAPCLFPLVMSLAPNGLQGRYNAPISLASSAGFVLAPTLSGFLLGSSNENVFLLLMLLGCGSGIVLSWLLGRKLSRQINEIEAI